MEILKWTAGIALTILVVDALGFCAWVFSGQHPIGEAYVGTITAHVIAAFVQ